jgi:hypothetical protein
MLAFSFRSCTLNSMDSLKQILRQFDTDTHAKITPKEYKQLAEVVLHDALEYYQDAFLDNDMLSSILEDIRKKRL